MVARRAGVNFTYAQLQLWFCICGMIVPGSSYWPIAYGLNPGEAANDGRGSQDGHRPGGEHGLAAEEAEVERDF